MLKRLYREESGEVLVILLVVTLLIASAVVACDPKVRERISQNELATQRARTEEAQHRADEARYRVKEKEIEGENTIRSAYAFNVRVTTVVWAAESLGAPVLAIGAVVVVGLCFLWLLMDDWSPFGRRW